MATKAAPIQSSALRSSVSIRRRSPPGQERRRQRGAGLDQQRHEHQRHPLAVGTQQADHPAHLATALVGAADEPPERPEEQPDVAQRVSERSSFTAAPSPRAARGRAAGRPSRRGRGRRSRGRSRSPPAAPRGCRGRRSAVVEDDDLVGQRDGREAVGDDERGPPGHRLAQPRFDLRLGGRVDRGGGVVEDQDARIGEQGAGDRHPLALPAGEGEATLADRVS